MRAVSYFFICVFFFSISCRKENSPTTSTTSSRQHHEKFASYIAAFTSGVISKTASIKIRLRVPVPETSSITEELFEFKPSIKGSTYWQDNQTIVFQPNQPLPSGEEFKASFYLRKVLKEVEEPFEFTFKTYPQLITVNLDGLESYDSKNLQWQKVFGNVSLVDMENTEDLKSVFKAIQNGLPLPVKWLQSERSTLHRFYIDSVRRTEQEGSVLLSWDGEKIGSKEKGEKTFTIPALGDFRVLEVEVFQNPSQHISVLFSDPLDNNQNLNGLVRLSNGAAIRYNISQNQLKIYPTQRQTGKTQLMLSSIKNSLGYKIPDELTYTVVFQDIKPAVRFVGNGNIMPSTKGLILPFEAVNLSAVKVIIVKIYEKNIPQFLQINQLDGMSELGRVGSIVFKGEVKLTASKPIDYGTWNAFSIDLSNYISAEPGAIYRVMFSFDKKHSLYPCTGDDANLSEEQTSLLSERDNWQDENNAYTSYDFEDESYYYYDYYDREYNPCENEYYKQYRRKVFKNILATDLGVIVKGSSMGEYTVAVTDLKTTSYVSNAKIEMLDYQLQPIASGITDSEGIAKISMSKKPYLLVATKEKQKGYLRLDDASSLSLSAFDVDGQKTKKGVKGFIYGERGVWRPGDSLHLSFILEDKENVLPDDHPVILELYDPLNSLVTKKVSNKHVGGIYYFGTAFDENALTGNWNAYVTVGASTFTKQIRVETIKPNRLKISFQVEETITSDVTEARLKASWLNGASAKELRANVRMTLSPTKTTFKGYENYCFDNPTVSFEEKAHDVYDSQLNDEGEALVNIHMPKIHGAGGMLKAVFTTRVFEKSGDFSTDQVAVNYSPYPSYVGIQAPKTESWEGLDASKAHIFKVVTVNPYGKPLSRNLKVKVYRLKWRWWWEANEDEYLADYVGNESVYLVKEFEVQTGTNGEGTFNLKIDEVDDYSRYLVMVNDRSGHATGEKVFFSPAGGEEKVATGATMLVFSTDKPKYSVGDKIKVSVPSGGVGKIFVTLEKGS
ncbi:MAG: MG2 domain-containing protein, partial [Flammeovirgaceae bacterium]|nr:MG2 domain-containing protein [Flammeovirgaceae bacterium]MDW8287384.1 MG2 domain-containing protein [Flammeovirgaceae bacterium]